jgi:hypothetical protein
MTSPSDAPGQIGRGHAEAKIKEALTCPKDWAEVFQLEPGTTVYPLEALWRDTINAHAVDDEAEFLFHTLDLDAMAEQELGDTSDEDLRRFQINFEHGETVPRNPI